MKKATALLTTMRACVNVSVFWVHISLIRTLLDVDGDVWLMEIMGSCRCRLIQWYRQTRKAEIGRGFAKLVQWNSTYPDVGYPGLQLSE